MRRIAAVVAAAALAGVIPAGAAAHAIVTPAASRPAELQQYAITVPTELPDQATVEVDVKVPDGVGFLLVEDAPGWRVVVERRADRIDVVRYTGGSIPPDGYATFRLIARNPVQEGELVWKVKQVYAKGRVVLWAGDPGSDTPASRTRISESAPADGVIDVVGGRSAGVAPAPAVPGATGGSGGGSSGLAAGLGAAGLALGALALGLVLLRRRGGRG